MNDYIGIDLGGTKIASAICNQEGKILHSITIPTDGHKSMTDVLDKIVDLIKSLIKKSGVLKDDVKKVVLGVPGPIDKKNGIILQAPNLPNWKNVPIVKYLSKYVNCAVLIENDANCAAMGEFLFGAGRGYQNIIFMTVSTGIGGGIIYQGKLLAGTHDIAGEIGHMTLNVDKDNNPPLCKCGRLGCLEAYASGTSMAERARKRIVEKKNLSVLKSGGETIWDLAEGNLDKITSIVISKAADLGDKMAIKLIEETATYLGIGIVNLINVMDPELIIVGGGVSLIGDRLFEKIRETVAAYSSMTSELKTKIVPAQLGGEAGLYGTLAVGLKAV